MRLVTTPAEQCLLLIWRTEFLFCSPERQQLAGEWNHVRLTSLPLPEQPNLLNHQLDRPLPFSDGSLDAIYSFHAIEHLDLDAGRRFVRDIYRLLKPNGVCRISTPDLEFHASEYLGCLRQQAEASSVEHYADYQWALCNVLDQMVRNVSGGEMLEIIRRGEYRPDYVKHLNGDLLQYILPQSPGAPSSRTLSSSSRWRRALENPGLVLGKVVSLARRLFGRSSPTKGYLELSHEKNLWFYDRISLGKILSEAGFEQIEVRDYRTSSIPEWSRYDFDKSVVGDYPLEPSLYMEAVKPANRG